METRDKAGKKERMNHPLFDNSTRHTIKIEYTRRISGRKKGNKIKDNEVKIARKGFYTPVGECAAASRTKSERRCEGICGLGSQLLWRESKPDQETR